MWTRVRWLATFMSACSEMPVDAASLITATSFSPFWKASFSAMLTCEAPHLYSLRYCYS